MKIPASLLNSFDLKETNDIELSKGFFVTLCENNATNPLWARRARDFIANNPDHPASGDEFGKFMLGLRDNVTDKAVTDFIADVLVIGWKSDELEEYSPENARLLLGALPRLASNILTQASIEANFRNAEVDDAVKN